jgi:microcystin-dependent protein
LARNGSGTFTKVNTFVSSTPITASAHNANWDDLASEITNSVAADGQTTMTGPLKASNGSVTNPSLTFGSDTNAGIYRIGADNIGIAANGAKVVDVATTGVTVTGDINATGVLKQAGIALLPLGMVLPYAGLTEPSGYLFCYGQAVSRTTYAALYAIVADTYGAGDGSTTFNLPDLRGRTVAGQDDMGGSSANRLTNADDGLNGDTLGASGGGETQTLATANLPAYTPTGTNAGGAASFTFSAASFQPGANTVEGTDLQTSGGSGGTITMNAANSNFTQPTFTGTAQGGTSTAFGIVQPTFILNYIIFAGV